MHRAAESVGDSCALREASETYARQFAGYPCHFSLSAANRAGIVSLSCVDCSAVKGGLLHPSNAAPAPSGPHAPPSRGKSFGVSTNTESTSAQSPTNCTMKPTMCPYSQRMRSRIQSAGTEAVAARNVAVTVYADDTFIFPSKRKSWKPIFKRLSGPGCQCL